MLLKVVVVLLLTEFREVLLPSVNVVIVVVVISSVLSSWMHMLPLSVAVATISYGNFVQ